MNAGIGNDFVKKTQWQYQLVPQEIVKVNKEKGIENPPLQIEPPEGAALLDLPDPADIKLGDMSLRTAIDMRRSHRKYTDQPFTVEELSFLLWCTQGVKQVTERPSTLRTVPSAGARHPFETYLVVNRVQGLEPGLYRFLAIGHKLVQVSVAPDLAERIVDAYLPQTKYLAESHAVTFIWVADAYRMTWRYGERGYRYIYIEAGHICQNLHLAAESLEAGIVAVGAVAEEKLNDILGLDGEELFVAYMATAGKR